MSAGPGRREVAHRLFAAEYDDASLEFAESDEERAPNYVVTPTGARVNRLFAVGVLTTVEQVNEDTIRARIADPTGAFVVYAGQYQPDELAALQSIEPPAFVAVTGKANTFQPEGSDRVLTSVRPERVTEVDAETRDRWVTTTAEHTLARIQTLADAMDRDERGEALTADLQREGFTPGVSEGVAKAIDHYGTTADYLGALQELALQALEVVAGERDEAESLELAPDDVDGSYAPGDLQSLLDEEIPAPVEAAGDEPVPAEPVEEPEPAAADSGTDGPASGEEATDAGEDPSATAVEEADEGATEETAYADEQPSIDGVDEPSADVGEATSTDVEGASTDVAEEAATATADEDASSPDERAAEPTTDDGTESPETFEVDEEEREEIEEEYGVGFQSGTEVDEPGEAGIEPEAAPDPAGESGDADVSEAGGSADAAENGATPDEEDVGGTDDDEAEDADDAEDEEAVDLEETLLEQMGVLDEGEGADRDALVEAVTAETGADAGAVDDAIDDALMSGQCYEPSEDRLKPI